MLKNNLVLLFVCLAVFCHSQGFINYSDSLGFENSYGDGEYGCGVSFVDFNQDGLDDISYPSAAFDDLYFHQNTGGDFMLIDNPVNNGSEVKQMLWVDYDNDQDMDLYVCAKVKNQLYKNLGGLQFENITNSCGFDDPTSQSFSSVWMDYDEDGLLDLFVSHRVEYLIGTLTLYKNMGDDQFEDVTLEAGIIWDTDSSPLVMTSFDYNNDGWEDLYVGQDYFRGNVLLKNNGDGTFDDVSVESGTEIFNNSMTASICDYNQDSWMDLYLTNTPEGNTFLVNQGDGTFLDLSDETNLDLQQFTWGTVFLDAENDMDEDVYVSGNYSDFNTSSNMMMNQGAGLPFLPVNSLWGTDDEGNNSVGNAIGDFNSDGYPDIIKINKDQPHTFWKNEFSGNNYLKIHLNAQISNSMAVGSKVEIVTGDIHQYKRLACGEGFASQNSNTLMFGLGDLEILDSIIVSWPNGIQSVLYDIPVNQTLEVYEFIEGCTDALACNYNPTATDDDSSCILPEVYYNCEGSCINDIDLDGICNENEIPGCTDIYSCTFDSLATDDDGSCIYPEDFYNCEGECLLDTDGDGICDELEVFGCVDQIACNFDSLATEDDASCYYVNLFEISGEELSTAFDLVEYSYPENLGSSYYWNCETCEIISGQGTSSIELSWLDSGLHNVSVQETLENGCLGAAVFKEINVLIYSVSELEGTNWKIYPNPVKNNLKFQINAPISYPYYLKVFDSKGVLVSTENIYSSRYEYDCSHLKNGIYRFHLFGPEFTHSRNIIIQH